MDKDMKIGNKNILVNVSTKTDENGKNLYSINIKVEGEIEDLPKMLEKLQKLDKELEKDGKDSKKD